MKLYRCFTVFSIILVLIIYFPCFIEAVNCKTGGECTPISKFNANIFNFGNNLEEKKCDAACAVFWCLIDHKKVFLGAGCYSDYEKICATTSSDAKIDVSDAVYMIEPVIAKSDNHFVVACNHEDFCSTQVYINEAQKHFAFFTSEFQKDANFSFVDACEYPEKVSDPSSTGFMTQMNCLVIFGMMFLGIICGQIWSIIFFVYLL
uniref:Transmembrane protein n=1 Tax=Panagrolaimus sp. ES5 TaxID=591445 RepID=A0AC34G2R7_9BILA